MDLLEFGAENGSEVVKMDIDDNCYDASLSSNNNDIEKRKMYDDDDDNEELKTKFITHTNNLTSSSCPVNNLAKRKDTKDSGYGDALSEHEDEQEAIPEWCRQYQETTIHEDVDDNLGNAQYTANRDQFVSRDNYTSSDDEITYTDTSKKPAKRHRRITPVPISNLLKLCVASKPDCLFVEEEDAEDIKNFNSEDDFIDQGFISQMADSPKWKHKSLQNTGQYNDGDCKQDCNAADNSKLFMRSKSENATNRQRDNSREFHKVPSIELVPPSASLPTWMQEARQSTLDEEQSNTTELKNCNYQRSVSLSVELPGKNESSKKVDINEDVLKIYLPSKEEKVKKGSRVRKLTPVRPTSPSLDKLSDLQRQVSASSLMEDVTSEVDHHMEE